MLSIFMLIRFGWPIVLGRDLIVFIFESSYKDAVHKESLI